MGFKYRPEADVLLHGIKIPFDTPSAGHYRVTCNDRVLTWYPKSNKMQEVTFTTAQNGEQVRKTNSLQFTSTDSVIAYLRQHFYREQL